MSLRIFCVSLLVSPLKVKINSEINAVAPDRRRRICNGTASIAAFRLDSDGSHAREFSVQRYSPATEHDRIPAVTEGNCGDVAKTAWRGIEGLLPNVNLLEAPQGYVLWVEVVVRFQEPAVERGSLCACWKRRTSRHAELTQIWIIVPIHEQRHEFQVLVRQIARKSDAIERLVINAHQLRATFGKVVGWPLADVGKCTDAFLAKAAFARRPRSIEGLTEGQVHIVGSVGGRRPRHHVGREVDAAFVAAQHADGITRVAIRRMACQFHANFIVTVTEIVDTPRNVEVINLVNPAVIRQE